MRTALAECKFCGAEVHWTNKVNPKTGKKFPPENGDWVGIDADPQEVYRWHGQKNNTCTPDDERMEEIGKQATAQLGGQPTDTKISDAKVSQSRSKDEAIQVMHDEKQEVSEGFLKSKQEYNKLYGMFVQVYLRDVALKEKALKLEAIKQGEDYATL